MARGKGPRVLSDLTEEEKYFFAILQDPSGIDQAEFSWKDEREPDGLFRCYDFQYPWYRCRAKQQIDQCARAIGKSVGIQMRAWAFAFTHPQGQMLITAPELIHLDPVTELVEQRILDSRLSSEFLKQDKNSNGIKHRPFEVSFRNGAKIMGRIPQKTGKGVKGTHPDELEQDEAQDYPEKGWVELGETLRFGSAKSAWRAHGVSKGVRDQYFLRTQKESGWTVHRYTAMHRPDWTAAERESKIEFYGGSRDAPDYRRNILGMHGDAQSALFVLAHLMKCVDLDKTSAYNTEEYYRIKITDERLVDSGMGIADLLDFPASHQAYDAVWVGMDVGLTNHPSEILIFGEEFRTRGGDGRERDRVVLKNIARVNLQRISAPNQRRVLEKIWDFYRPQAIAMDSTGLGLPIWQEIMDPEIGAPVAMQKVMRAYNFSKKILVGYEQDDRDPDDYYDPDWAPTEILANVLEYSSDMLRLYVDKRQIQLPYDPEVVKQFQGQTYAVTPTVTDPYGKKKFNAGEYHALDAARMAILGHMQQFIDAMGQFEEDEPVLDMFLTA